VDALPPIRNNGKRHKRTEFERRLVFTKTGGLCFYCWEALDYLWDYVCDHYIPLSKYGIDDHSNLVPACKFCDQRKGSRLPTPILCDTLKRWKRGEFKFEPIIDLPDGTIAVANTHLERKRAARHQKNQNAIQRGNDKLTRLLPNPVLPWEKWGNHTDKLYGDRRDDQCTETRTPGDSPELPGGDASGGLYAGSPADGPCGVVEQGDHGGGVQV
jgi:hypothetical protein